MWRGVAAFTWRTKADWELLTKTLATLWPGVCIIAAPGELGKRALERNLAGSARLGKVYLGRMRHRKIRHSDVGGVTRSVWSVWCLVHEGAPSGFRVNLDWTLVPYQRWAGADLNPVTKYRRMELAIDQDGEAGHEPGVITVGHVSKATWRQAGALHDLPGGIIYSDQGLLGEGALVPDPSSGSRPVWMETGTVFKKERIVRPLSAEERALIWDYPNLVPPKGRAGSALAQHGMRDCLDGPPGKVVRTVLFHVLEQMLPIWGTRGEPTEVPATIRVEGVDTG
eukprot:scaffold174359_cov57-Attheya_sp.AAC.1